MRNGKIKNHHVVLKCDYCGNIFAHNRNLKCPKCNSFKTRYIKYQPYILELFGIKPKTNPKEGY